MKKITKAKSKEFVTKATEYFESLGFKPSNIRNDFYVELSARTNAGLLTISIRLDQSICYTVTSLFHNAREAKLLIPCSTSGKYNFYQGDGATDIKRVIDNLKIFFSGIQILKTKYVWISPEGKFSNSWSEKEERERKAEGLVSIPASDKWRLIKYTCVNDNNFEFYNKMRLA